MEYPILLLAPRLFQQCLVDGYKTIESHRLLFVSFKQDLLRVENYNTLSGAVQQGDVQRSSASSHFIVPPSFVEGGPYVRVNYLDTMTIYRWFGYPDLFITFTCNPKWLKITHFVSKRGLNPEDSPDILYRVLKIKLDELMIDFNERHIFGRVRANPVGLQDYNHRVWLGLKAQKSFPGSVPKEQLSTKTVILYLSACEATWRIFTFDIHHRTPAVERLQFHLPGEHSVFFNDEYPIDEVVGKSSMGVSKFLSWMKINSSHKEELQWDVVHAQSESGSKHGPFYQMMSFAGLELTKEELNNYALIDIEESLQLNGSSLARCEGIPLPYTSTTSHHGNMLVMDELSYDRELLQAEHASQLSSMTDEQRSVYNQIMDVVASNQGGVFFVYGYEGTGKTFIWRTLRVALRSLGEIVLPVASSGIAATLIPGGRTAHLRLGISLNVTENSTCPRIKPGSDLAELLIRAKLIIWDEVSMTHKHSLEVVDKSLKDVMRVVDVRNATLPFGGKVVVFGGDFWQTLPVVQKGSRTYIVHKSSAETNVDEIRKFSEWILEIGDGLAGDPKDGEVDIEFPDDDPDYLKERAILAPTHEIVEDVNDYVLSLIDGQAKLYISSDEVSKDDATIGV
ncbi:uncharacterized protein LOC141655544 [Silene latifolia]|uniref:uncharacterized protein LOC141655544 n=1 Tax=Silene latifolia TaxID=37657 RepID=UPI003D76B997